MKSFKHMLLFLWVSTLAFGCNASDDANTSPARRYADVDFTNNSRPLVLMLHGFADGNQNAHKNTAFYAEPGFEALNTIILSPINRGLQWFHPYNQNQANTLIDMAKSYLSVDNTKIVVNSYSDGGNGA